MKVKGERFYDIFTYQKAKFGYAEVVEVILHNAVIERVDDDDNVVATCRVYMVQATLESGQIVMTKPNTNQDHVATVAHELANRVEMSVKGN